MGQPKLNKKGKRPRKYPGLLFIPFFRRTMYQCKAPPFLFKNKAETNLKLIRDTMSKEYFIFVEGKRCSKQKRCTSILAWETELSKAAG